MHFGFAIYELSIICIIMCIVIYYKWFQVVLIVRKKNKKNTHLESLIDIIDKKGDLLRDIDKHMIDNGDDIDPDINENLILNAKYILQSLSYLPDAIDLSVTEDCFRFLYHSKNKDIKIDLKVIIKKNIVKTVMKTSAPVGVSLEFNQFDLHDYSGMNEYLKKYKDLTA